MSVVTVRNLDAVTQQRLKARARTNGRSMESEVRAILTAAVTPAPPQTRPLGSRIAALFATVDVDGEGVELSARGTDPVRAAEFDA